MKLLLKTAILLGVLGAGTYFAYAPVMAYWKSRNKVYFRTAEVERGEIVSVVNSTGTIQPVLRVEVGSFVSGPIKDLFADFNQEVAEGEILAKIDPRLYEAAVARETASLKTRKAEIARVEALLEQAANEEKRALELRARHKDFISDTELDQIVANHKSLKAQLEVAEAAVDQAQANLENAELNLEYTDIRSPVAGRVIDRNIDRGQTRAAQFQTPQLFVVAPDMEEEMHVFASVDEADIGLIRKAQQSGAAGGVHRRRLPRRPVHRKNRRDPIQPDDRPECRHLPGRGQGPQPRTEAAARHDREHLVPDREAAATC